MSVASNIRELNFFIYSLIESSCFSLASASQATHELLLGKNYSFRSHFKVSHVLILGYLALVTSWTRVLHHNLAPLANYMFVVIIFSESETFIATK